MAVEKKISNFKPPHSRSLSEIPGNPAGSNLFFVQIQQNIVDFFFFFFFVTSNTFCISLRLGLNIMKHACPVFLVLWLLFQHRSSTSRAFKTVWCTSEARGFWGERVYHGNRTRPVGIEGLAYGSTFYSYRSLPIPCWYILHSTY